MKSTHAFAAALSFSVLATSGCAMDTEAPAGSDELEIEGEGEVSEAPQPLTDSPATTAEPWIVNLAFTGIGARCTASVLTAHWLLTAAHCVDSLSTGALTTVSVSTRNSAGSVVNVYTGNARTYQHTFYDSGITPDVDNDIAIVRLTGATGVNLSVTGTARLFGYTSPWTSTSTSDREFSIIGYGLSGPACAGSDTTKRIATGFVMDKEGFDVRKIMSPYASKHTCDGDSGAPWLLTRNGVRSILGVHSGRYYDVSSRVMKQQAALLPPKRTWMYETSKNTGLMLDCGAVCTERVYDPEPPPGPACPSGFHCCEGGGGTTCNQCLPNSVACP
ncbi:trypsin-like serine protease [Sorangium sp. So ce542]|uniref:trypsin-like serine protease n=1 Tax=Sorangium sp. So ce542 TaxID=3133316 RepID=UPI003F622F94